MSITKINMPTWKDVYKGAEDWMSASDITEDIPAIIESVKEEDMNDGKHKLIVGFKGFKKSLVCNKTNAKKIAEIAGTDDYTKWKGTQIKLVKTIVEFKSEEVEAIRVKPINK